MDQPLIQARVMRWAARPAITDTEVPRASSGRGHHLAWGMVDRSLLMWPQGCQGQPWQFSGSAGAGGYGR